MPIYIHDSNSPVAVIILPVPDRRYNIIENAKAGNPVVLSVMQAPGHMKDMVRPA
jgi:hypothetical protein